MEIIGPPRTQALVGALVETLQVNAEIRRAENPSLPPLTTIFSAQDALPGEIYRDDKVRVQAVENTHYHLDPAGLASRNKSYALRFETPDRVIVFTGDTGESEAVARLAKGADVLVSEMATSEDFAKVPPAVRKHMLTEHLSPAQVGALAASAGVRLVVLTHVRSVSAQDLAEVRRTFKGRVVLGQDLSIY
jgi:ribonuclease BN (tRNA processing enzyme)